MLRGRLSNDVSHPPCEGPATEQIFVGRSIVPLALSKIGGRCGVLVGHLDLFARAGSMCKALKGEEESGGGELGAAERPSRTKWE
jgi:hypothetical protein